MTLDVSEIVGTLGPSRSGFTAGGLLATSLTGYLPRAQAPRAEPLDHASLLAQMAVGQRGSEHVAVLVTTALVKVVHPGDDRYSREALYEDMFAGLAALGYPHPLVVEAVHGYSGGAAPVLAAGTWACRQRRARHLKMEARWCQVEHNFHIRLRE